MRFLFSFGHAPSGRAIRSKSSRFPTAPGFPLLSLMQLYVFLILILKKKENTSGVIPKKLFIKIASLD